MKDKIAVGKSIAQQVAEIVREQSRLLMKSLAKAIPSLKDSPSTPQRNLDINNLQDAARNLLTIEHLTTMDATDSDTAVINSPKDPGGMNYKNISPIIDLLSKVNDQIAAIEPRKGDYNIASLFDSKTGVSVDRRLGNLKKLFKSYADRDDKKVLDLIREIKKASLVEGLMRVANLLDSIGQFRQADVLDSLMRKLVKSS